MSGAIHSITMPKWGLTMEQGTVAAWNKDVGERVEAGEEVCDVETEKIAGGIESPAAGILRRQVASAGDGLPIGALLGIIADESCTDEEIDQLIESFKAVEPESADGDIETGEAQAEHVEIAGRRVRHLVQQGEGTAVLLIHGFGGNLENWVLNHAALAATGRTVAALDLPGHGGSLKDIESGTLDELASTVLAYMDFMGFEQVDLVGHSMGAAVCLALSQMAPGRVKSVCLLAAAGMGQALNTGYIEGFTAAITRRQLKPVLQKLFNDKGLVTRQLVDDTLEYKRLDGVNQALEKISAAGLVEVMSEESLQALAARLPILAIWGSEDEVISVPEADVFSRLGIELHLIPGRGHMVQVEAADDVNRLIKGFLDR